MPFAEYTIEYLAKADSWATQLASEAADAQKTYEYLDSVKKDMLSKIMSSLNEGGTSESKLERLARATEEWSGLMFGLREARDAYIVARAKAANADRHWQTVRSGLKYRISEMERVSG